MKYIFLILFILIRLNANAQFNKGDLVFNSLAGYNQTSINSNGYNANGNIVSNSSYITKNLNTIINIGKCFKTNWVTGVYIALFETKNITNSSTNFMKMSKIKSDNYRIGLFFQKSSNIKGRYYFYIGMNSSIGHIENKYYDKDTIINDPYYWNGFSANISLYSGLNYLLSKKILFNIGVGDIGWSYKSSIFLNGNNKASHRKESQINLGLSALSLNVGITYRLNKNSKQSLLPLAQ